MKALHFHTDSICDRGEAIRAPRVIVIQHLATCREAIQMSANNGKVSHHQLTERAAYRKSVPSHM